MSFHMWPSYSSSVICLTPPSKLLNNHILVTCRHLLQEACTAFIKLHHQLMLKSLLCEHGGSRPRLFLHALAFLHLAQSPLLYFHLMTKDSSHHLWNFIKAHKSNKKCGSSKLPVATFWTNNLVFKTYPEEENYILLGSSDERFVRGWTC